MYFKGLQIEYQNYDAFLSLEVVLIVTNSADPDELAQHFIRVFTVC